MSSEAIHDRPLDPAVLEEAADWLLRLSDRSAGETERQACERWRQQAPEHARAWARAERLHGLLATVPAALAHPVLDRPLRIDRRKAIKHLGVWLLFAPSGWLAWRLWERSAWNETLQTAVGARRQARLADGSRIDLDTETAVDVAFGSRQRLLRLRQGQVLIATAADPQQPPRPFRVATAHGRMQALGTLFDVRIEGPRTRLAVLEGAVRVEPGGLTTHALQIQAGQQVTFDVHGYGPVQDADARVAAWRHGMLAADAMPLGQLLDELARYRNGLLRCDPAIADMPVSGAFPLDDTDRSLAMLASTYPVQVRRARAGWMTQVVARPPAH